MDVDRGKTDTRRGEQLPSGPTGPSRKGARIVDGWTKTHSRPHVSNGNPYSESAFKTLKYRRDFPDRFGCLADTRAFCGHFYRWYNYDHRHSGSGCTPPPTSTMEAPTPSGTTARKC